MIKYVNCEKACYDSIKFQSHRLSKGKVHCSCPLCAFHGETRQDLRNRLAQINKIKDYIEEGF